MTSIPASRRARAITFAPRSWPSRPGLATSTRILRSFLPSSAIQPQFKHTMHGFTTETASCSKAKWPCLGTGERLSRCAILLNLSAASFAFSEHFCFCLRFKGLRRTLRIQALPQIPARKRAVRHPGPGDLLHLRGLGHSAFAVVPADRSLDSEISGGEDVGPPQREHQEHLRRPGADAFDLGQMGDHLVVGHIWQIREVEFSALRQFSQRADVTELLLG